MRRSPRNPQPVPVQLAEAAQSFGSHPHVLNAVQSTETRDWYRIENKTAESVDVYLYDEIGMWGVTASDFVNEIAKLDTKEIKLHINSPGGSVFDGVAIYNSLVNHKASITVMVDGLAASAASFIAQSGDSVIMGTGSTMMIHEASGGVWGNAEDMRQTADILDKLSGTISEFYAIRAGGSAAMWRGIMKAETWYTAQEAVDAGLADSVSKTKADATENRWDMSVFNYASRSDAPSPEQVLLSVMNKITDEENTMTDDVTPDEEEIVPDEEVEPQPDVTDEEVIEDIVPSTIFVNGLQAVLVNGVPTSDVASVQAHILALEQFADESKKSARESYVQNLAADGKIVAPQVDGLKSFVNTLSDGQYSAFVASWDAAPKLPLFGRHGAQNSSDTVSKEKEDRLRVVKDIVKHHRDSNMPEDVLKTKDSYIEMIALEAELGA